MIRNKLARWLFALALVSVGIVLSFVAARWLKAMLGLPSLAFRMKAGSPADLTDLALAVGLFIPYLFFVPKLFRISADELGDMLSGK